eukprot:3189239-Rhodomonas_salina.2
MCGTELAYAATTHCAISGTELAYAATVHCVISGTDLVYAATIPCAMFGTDSAYAATIRSAMFGTDLVYGATPDHDKWLRRVSVCCYQKRHRTPYCLCVAPAVPISVPTLLSAYAPATRCPILT